MRRDRVFEVLEHGRRRDGASRTLDAVLVTLIVVDICTAIVQSVPQTAPEVRSFLTWLDRACVLIFALEYGARLWAAPEHAGLRGKGDSRARWEFALTPLMLVDAIALAPILLEWLFPDLLHVELFRIVRFLKFARYSPALGTVGWVVLTERRALLACLVIIMGIMLASAAVMMAVEGHLQPNHLGDMPKAIWWSASMLAKIGGGETSPVTAAGRIIAALTVMLGIFCFALPVAILGRGFYAEIRKRDFVVTFAMVARVPLFADLDAGTIAELVDLLKARTVSAGAVIVRKGERGDALYFLASGIVEVRDNGAVVSLHERDYFGEMALLANVPRSATVVATRVTDLLVLEAEDFYRIVNRTPELRAKMEMAARQRLPDQSVAASAG